MEEKPETEPVKTVAEWYSQGLATDTPRVSVATITYGHEPYIAETIEGVLMQEVDFPVEFVIGEDCSPDRSREIIEGYCARYPGLIRLSDYDHNIGAAANFQTTVNRCRGEYIALLDGDDFWIEPHKLRAQAELLDQNPRYSACFHATNLVQEGEVVVARVDPRGRQTDYALADIADQVYMATSSILFRRSELPGFPSWYSECFFGDFVLKVLLAEKGNIGFIPEVLGSRRLHPGSIWLGGNPKSSESARLHIGTLDHICRHLKAPAAKAFEQERQRAYHNLIHALIDEGSRQEASKALAALKANQVPSDEDGRGVDTGMLRILAHYYAPPLYRLVRAARRRRGSDSDPARYLHPR